MNEVKGFTCTQCGECCKNFSSNNRVIIFPSDIKRVSRKLEVPEEDFVRDFTYQEKTKIQELEVVMSYLKDNNGECNFLVDNKCSIHHVKPAQCENGPFGMFWNGELRFECMKNVEIPDGYSSEETDMKFVSEYFQKLLKLNH